MRCKKETQYSYLGDVIVRLTEKCASPTTTTVKGNLTEIEILIDNWGTYILEGNLID
jgi:hypothetical protein